jgi:hypothetical protein
VSRCRRSQRLYSVQIVVMIPFDRPVFQVERGSSKWINDLVCLLSFTVYLSSFLIIIQKYYFVIVENYPILSAMFKIWCYVPKFIIWIWTNELAQKHIF